MRNGYKCINFPLTDIQFLRYLSFNTYKHPDSIFQTEAFKGVYVLFVSVSIAIAEL